jgi:adenosylcobinamide-phosphate synthase
MGREAWLPLLAILLAPLLAAGLDQLLGDPRRWPHPVQAMGAWIALLRQPLERWAGDRPGPLRLAGLAITAATLSLSAAAGLALEWLAAWGWRQGLVAGLLFSLPLLLGLASALAGRSLEQAVQQVLELLPPGAAAPGCDLEPARRQLAWIVGRDTERLAEPEILRALAETASENAVDGLFAPLFWMLVGGGCSLMALAGLPLALVPGPLSLAWGFKASSTLDSMLGYRRGRLRWLGTAGARLDDALTWIPCRLVALSLPLAASRPLQTWSLFRQALQQGRPDPSPNAGVSQAAYALAAQVRLGGLNHYGGEPRPKPILAPDQPPADRTALARILVLSRRLLLIWLLIWLLAGSAISWRLGMLASLRPEVSRSTRPEPQVLRR